jgi:hypothetical protein
MAASARVLTMASDVSTNLLKLNTSRKKPRPGDVFGDSRSFQVTTILPCINVGWIVQ